MTVTSTNVYESVLAANAAGISVVPARQDGSKRPITYWTPYQAERPSDAQLTEWFAGGTNRGVFFVCGKVSGNLEMLELEDLALYEPFKAAARSVGLGDMLERIEAGYFSESPGGGGHLLYRCETIAGNTVLAKRPKRPEEMRDDKDRFQVVFETRGEGGGTVEPPSNGTVHPTGGRYVQRRGGVATIATITPEERADLHALARTYDQMPPSPPHEPREHKTGSAPRPGDDFNNQTDLLDLMTARGWAHVYSRGEAHYLRRPGKTEGVSATINHAGNGLLWIFTSSTEFEPNKSYTAFGAYTVLAHGGDFLAATKDLAARGYGAPAPPINRSSFNGQHVSGDDDQHMATEPAHLSDLGNAKRLVAQHGADLRYCPTFGKWYAWDGGHWLLDETGEVYRRAKQTVQAIYAEAATAAGDDERKALAKHALRSEGEARIRAMVGLAESEPDIPVLPPELDRDPWLFNVENGTIDLRTGKLRSHRRDDLLTHSIAITHDDLAECPTWLAFLDRVLSGKQDLIAFVQRAIGYSLTGRTVERLLFILWGMGRNGKSTLLETILELLGGYASRTSTDTLLATRDGAIPNDVARLRGMRFVFASEAEEGRRLAEAKIKDLTGGDTISARFMRGEWFDFRPEFKLFLATNHKPVIRGTDNAVWDRVRLIPFNVRIPDDELDPDLRDKLLAEAPGILTWAVEGCLAWQKHGLKAPEDVRAATNAYREEMDVLGHFLDECCVIEATVRATAKELYASYQAWCGDAGEKPISQKAFGQRLAERGLDSAQFGKSRARYWIGVGLLDHHEPQRGANASGGVNA